jgi:hypothetical protein
VKFEVEFEIAVGCDIVPLLSEVGIADELAAGAVDVGEVVVFEPVLDAAEGWDVVSLLLDGDIVEGAAGNGANVTFTVELPVAEG